MKIKTKVEILLVAIIVLFALLDYGVQRFFIYSFFQDLENKQAKTDLSRCLEAIHREEHHLEIYTKDWALWDDAYAFMEGASQEFMDSNLTPDTFEGGQLNLIYFVSPEGKVVWGRILENEQWVELDNFPARQWPAHHRLLLHDSEKMSKAGVILTEKGPMLVAASQILTTDMEGPCRGTLIMGRFFNQETIDTLVGQTNVQFMVWPIEKGLLPESERTVLNTIEPGQIHQKKSPCGEQMLVYGIYPDIQGGDALLLKARVPREISAMGKTAMTFAFLSVLVLGLLTLLAIHVFFVKVLASPLSRLTRHIAGIMDSGHLSSRLHLNRKDEIGTLAQEYDRMLERLEEDTRERERLSQELRQLSQRDGLTDLYNRRYFNQQLIQEWQRAMRQQHPVSIIMMDIDFFKKYNDEHGHIAGDVCLKKVATLLAEAAQRPSDTVARYGGEEFVLLLGETPLEGALQLAQTIQEKLGEAAIPHGHSSASEYVTVSIGVSTETPLRFSKPDGLLMMADEALYEAKESGRNQIKTKVC